MENFTATPRRVEIVPSFWTLPSLKSAPQNHEGPTETRKGHSAHGHEALSITKPTKETEGMNHHSQSANNQSSNQSIDRSVDQSINQSTQSIDWWIDQSQFNSIEQKQSISANSRIEYNWENRTTINQATRDQIVNRSLTGKRKVD